MLKILKEYDFSYLFLTSVQINPERQLDPLLSSYLPYQPIHLHLLQIYKIVLLKYEYQVH